MLWIQGDQRVKGFVPMDDSGQTLLVPLVPLVPLCSLDTCRG